MTTNVTGSICFVEKKNCRKNDIRIEFASCLLVSSASRAGTSDAPEQSRQLRVRN